MRRSILLPALFLLRAACTRGDGVSTKRLDEMERRLEALDERSKDIDGRLVKIEDMIREATQGPKEPDPAVVYAVPVDGDPYRGPEHAKVTMVEAFEFACPFCAKVNPTVDALLAKYPNDLKVVYKYFVVHEVAVVPGLASCAAGRQGKFAEMEHLIWEKGFAVRDLSPENMDKLAQEAGLDMKRYKADIEGESCKNWLMQSQQQLQQVGTAGTPAFYINGRYVSGAQPLETFTALIDEELAKANQAISSGVALEAYYQSEVVQKGTKSL
jgi:protein-disulfide isomerase